MVIFSNPPGVHAPLASYTHSAAVPAGTELIFFSGQVGVGLDGSLPTTLAEQADQAFANVVALLDAHGLKPGDILRLTTYVVAGQELQGFREARQKHLGSHQPISTLLFVSRLSNPAWLIELEAIAVKGGIRPA